MTCDSTNPALRGLLDAGWRHPSGTSPKTGSKRTSP